MSSLIISPELTSPCDDAIQLYRAFKGFRCDTTAVINILAHRDSVQRALIQQEYKIIYAEDLNKRLSSELSNNVKRAVSLWIHDPAKRDATIVRQALTGNVVDFKAATEIICFQTQSQLEQFRYIYVSLFNSLLVHDIEFLASGDLKKLRGGQGSEWTTLICEPVDPCGRIRPELLVAYLNNPRNEGPEIDRALVTKDAKALFKAGEKKLGTDESVFIKIFSERSSAHMVAVNSAYNDMYGHTLKQVVKMETSGDFEFALLTILGCAQNPGKYFAKRLYKAMKGMGTDDMTLIRIIVTRCEIDMQYIKAEYRKKYGKSLNDVVHSETSGHYRTFLLALLGPNL